MPHSFPTRPSSALHRHRLQGWACRGISALRPRYSCSAGELLARTAAAADGRLPAEADLLRELAALLGIIWRDHGIVGRQPPLRPVLVRGHLIVGHQVAFQHFELLAVLQTDDVIRLYRRAE